MLYLTSACTNVYNRLGRFAADEINRFVGFKKTNKEADAETNITKNSY